MDWKRLNRLSRRDPSQKVQKTWYVDWIVAYDQILILMVPDDEENYRVLRVETPKSADIRTPGDFVRSWLADNIDGRQRVLDLEPDEMDPLFELRPLVEPIIQIAQEGDLLVLCPTGFLHRVPLHTAILEGDKDDPESIIPLIARHPIVYTTSLTIYEQSSNRLFDRPGNDLSSPGTIRLTGAVLGVYEDSTVPGWMYERPQVYRVCSQIPDFMSWDKARCGKPVDHAAVRAALEADIAVFFGHMSGKEDENILDHGMELYPAARDGTPGVENDESSIQ